MLLLGYLPLLLFFVLRLALRILMPTYPMFLCLRFALYDGV